MVLDLRYLWFVESLRIFYLNNTSLKLLVKVNNTQTVVRSDVHADFSVHRCAIHGTCVAIFRRFSIIKQIFPPKISWQDSATTFCNMLPLYIFLGNDLHNVVVGYYLLAYILHPLIFATQQSIPVTLHVSLVLLFASLFYLAFPSTLRNIVKSIVFRWLFSKIYSFDCCCISVAWSLMYMA